MARIGRACLLGDFFGWRKGVAGGFVVEIWIFFSGCCAKDFHETGWVS